MSNYPTEPNPYRPNTFERPAKPASTGTPQVVIWEMVYCVAMGLLYLAVALLGVFMMLNANAMVAEDMDLMEIKITGVICMVMGFPLTLLFLAGLVWRRGMGGWIFHIVLISIGLTSACCLPTNIPLLIFWIKEKDRII